MGLSEGKFVYKVFKLYNDEEKEIVKKVSSIVEEEVSEVSRLIFDC